MTNNNISTMNVRALGLGGRHNTVMQGGGRGPQLGGGNDLISAIIQQKNAQGTVLALNDGQTLNVKSGEVVGEVGDKVFFELAENNGGTALRQVFPNVQGQEFLSKQASLSNLEELMNQKGYVHISDGQMDITSDMQSRLEERQRANEAAGRLARNIGRVSGNVHSAAVAQLAAEGINIDKIPVHVLSGVVDELEAAKVNNETRVYDELALRIQGVSGMGDGQITQILSHEDPLTLDNLYIYKHSGAEPAEGYLSKEDLQNLQSAIDRFFAENGIEKNHKNLERVHLLLDNQIPLTKDNFEKLIFLQDVNGNVNLQALLPYAVALDAQGEGLGGLNVYSPEINRESEVNHLKDAIYKHEARLAMSYEASASLAATNIEIDLNPQIEALNTLKEQEAALLTALKEIKIDTEIASQKMVDTYKAMYILPYVGADTVGALAAAALPLSLSNLEQHVAAQKYDENATMVSLKYGDTAAKIAEQFAPLLEELGLPTDKDSLRAAKVLTANKMDITAENLVKIKDVDAKITDIQNHMHPRIAAAMIAEGLNPATMHMDDILSYISNFKEEYGISDREQLLKHILQMDKEGDVDPAVRKQVMEIYQALHKIMRHEGAGIGFAVNAGIELTLQGLTDFAKNYNTSRGKNNTINFTAEDGVYYAKHLVTSFAEAAAPKPLSEFVQKESMKDPLPESVEKIKAFAEKNDALDVERINNAIKELSGTSRADLRALTAMGLSVTLANLRHLQATRDKKLEKDAQGLGNIAGLPKSDFAESLNPVQANEQLADQIEEMLENAINSPDTDAIKKIDQMEITLQNLAFKKMLLGSGRDFGFAMNFNGRLTDVQLHLLSDSLSVEEGVTTFVTLSTAMGDVDGLLRIKGEEIELTLAADAGTLNFLRENRDLLPENFNVTFKDKNVLKKQLSDANNLPIY